MEQSWKTVKKLIQEKAKKTIGKQKTTKKPDSMVFAKKQ